MNTKKILLLALAFGPVATQQISAQLSLDDATNKELSISDLTEDPNWKGAPDTFLLDETGMMTIDPSQPFRVLRYVGDGSVYSGESSIVSVTFHLKFEEGQSANVKGGSMAAGFVQFENLTDTQEAVGASLRQVSGAGPGMFNIFVINTFNGENSADFAPRFDAIEIGLEYDENDRWTDGTSDSLKLDFELVYQDGSWLQKASLVNLETSALVSSAILRSEDQDGSFFKNSRGFRINSDKLDQNPVIVNITTLDVAAK